MLWLKQENRSLTLPDSTPTKKALTTVTGKVTMLAIVQFTPGSEHTYQGQINAPYAMSGQAEKLLT